MYECGQRVWAAGRLDGCMIVWMAGRPGNLRARLAVVLHGLYDSMRQQMVDWAHTQGSELHRTLHRLYQPIYARASACSIASRGYEERDSVSQNMIVEERSAILDEKNLGPH